MKKVLVIEDDKEILEILGMIIENCNYQSILSPDLISISEVEEIKPDLIFLDQWLHKNLGSDFCKRVKENPATQEIPVILISVDVHIGEIAFENKADGCLEKPFDLEEVELVLRAYLI